MCAFRLFEIHPYLVLSLRQRALEDDSSDKENEGVEEDWEDTVVRKTRRTQDEVPSKTRKDNESTLIGLNTKKKPPSAPDPHALLRFAANPENPDNFDSEVSQITNTI